MKIGFLAAITITCACSAQTTWHVRESASGAATGLTWHDAFTDLQDALGAAHSGDEIWVAAGTYTPSTTDATASFVLIDGVGLFGGFAGHETSRSQRDWTANETILSGDIGRDDIVGTGPSWYVGWNRNTPNSGHVIDAASVGRGAIVDGFTIADGATGPSGTPAGHALMYGSGIYCSGASPTIRNCTFLHNLCAFAHGGGMYVNDGDPIVESCRFLENYAHLGNGAGLFIYGDSTVDVRDCAFARNIAVHGGSGGQGHGAGLYINTGLPALVQRCTFDQNTARYFYSVGGLEALTGGGLHSFLTPITVDACIFTRNRAAAGGGAGVWGEGVFINCLFADNDAIPQPNDPFPELGGSGGGLWMYSSSGQVSEVRSCTVVNNAGKKYGGILATNTSELIVENSVIWGNTATDPDYDGFWESQVSKSFDTIGYSCVQYIFGPKKRGEDPLEPSKRPGCIEDAPGFVPGTFELGAGSPCIDAARNAMVPPGVTLDLAGAPRFRDDPATPDTGVGTPPIVDMGAYEFQPETCYADCDGNTALDIFDFLCFQDAFVRRDPYADCNGNTVLDIFDFLCFQDAFVVGCP